MTLQRFRVLLVALGVLSVAGSSAISAGENSISKKMTVSKDSKFTIDLPCAAGQGFSWQLADSSFDGKLHFIRQTFDNGAVDKDGTDGIQHFEFEAIGEGSVRLRFLYVQPFRKPYPPDSRTADVAVTIEKGL